MAKQLNQVNVNLAFNADTSKAKQQIQDLQNQLSSIINMSTAGLGADMATKINQASRAAAELKVHLENATNVKTGNLDFTKLNQSIKNSGTSLSAYAAKLKEIGPQGQTAFNSLAQAVAGAEVPIRRSNALLNELWVTMKNTARWQLTSSMLHGFIGAVKSAVGYTKDLNESLNNIRIVTGQSVEQMAEFAKEANKAAKSLSTSTLNYTDAALIYYQQGLDDTQVKERTDITIKMANVSRQSAEEVSDQMTAVWNNFAKGSESLEHFADVMTRLGADTASSSDEIAQGLEKFAAIADMIGLSFDNAAAALATVTATTRQSADVVGTAFKTIFARIQGLSLGETLDDGTNLNKYSKALEAVGINIKNQNGELKDMDSILEEMGSKWKTLSKDQQVALAQTVAGVRQYNQLIALMDNFDFYKKNLSAAQNSAGSLQEQADIYAESWEAAAKRVRASWEDLWGSLIDDKAFIGILNILSKIVDGFDLIIDSVGGFSGVISSLGLIFSKVFQKQILSSITNASYSLRSWTESGRESIRQEKSAEINRILQLQGKAPKGSAQDIQNQVIRAQLESQQQLINNAKNLTEEEQKVYQILLDQQKVRGDLAVKAAQEVEQKKKQVNKQKINLISKNEGANKQLAILEEKAIEKAKYAEMDISELSPEKRGELIELNKAIADSQTKLIKTYKYSSKDITNFTESVTDLAIAEKQSEAATNEGTKRLKISNQQIKENTQSTQNNANAKNEHSESSKKSGQAVDKETQEIKEETQAVRESTKALDQNNNARNQGKTALYAKNFLSGAQAALTMATAISSLSNVVKTMQDPNIEGWDKFSSIAMSLSITLPMLGSSLSQFGKMAVLANGQTLAQVASTAKFSGVLGKLLIPLSKASAGMTAAAGGATTFLGSIAALFPYIAAAAAAIYLLVKGLDKLILTEKEARESINKANEAYEEQKKIVDELNDTLQTTKDRIDELNKQDTLSPVEQDELNKLQQELAYLERQLEIEKELEKTRQQEQVNEIVDKYAKANESLVEGPKKIIKRRNIGEGDGMWEYQSADEWWGDRTEAQKNNKAYKEEYNKWLDEEKQARTEWLNENKEAIQNAEQDYKSVIAAMSAGIEVDPEVLKNLQSTLGFIRKNTLEDGKYFELVIEPIFDSKAFNEQKNAIVKELNDKGTLKDFNFGADLKEQLQIAGISVNEFSIQIRNLYRNAKNTLDDIQGVPQDFIDSLSFEDLQLINESNFDTTEFDEFYRKFLELKNQKNSIVINIQMARDTAKDALNTLAQGNFLSEEQLTNLKEHFKDLYDLSNLVNMSMYDQARTISSALLNATIPEAAINNTINKVGELQEQLDALNETESELTDEKKILKIELEAELDQAKKDIAALTSEPINLSVEIDNSLIDGLMAQAGAIDKATSLITEGFKVEAKNVSELMKTMPQLFEDATVDIKTGVVQLQQDIVNSTIETAKAETEVERQGLIERLNARIIYLNGSIDSLNKLRTVAEANSDATKLKEEINSKLTLDEKKASAAAIIKAKIQQSIQEQTQSAKAASHSIQDQQHVTDASKIESETLYQNWQDALEEFNKAAYSAFSNAQAYQSAFTNNQPVGQLALNAKSSITGRSSSSTYQWDYNDGQENQYSNLQAFVDAGFDFSKIKGLDQTDDTAVQVYVNQIKEQWKDLFNTDLSGKALWGGAEGFTDQFFDMYKTAEALGIDTNLSVNDLQYELAEAIAQLSNTSSLNDALEKLKETGVPNKNGKDYRPEEERYYEITKEIEKQERALNRLQKTKDQAYGANKLKAIDNEIAATKKLKEANEELYRQQKENLEKDAKALLSLFPQADIANGYIANYNELLLKTTSEEQKKILDQYASTWEAMEATYDKLLDFDNQIKDLNYEKLNYELELKVDIEDAELKRLDYFLNKFSDDFYKMAESAVLMMDKIEPTSNLLSVYQENVNKLNEKYQNGNISQEDYIEGLKNARDAIYEQLEALNELDKQMLHYYEDTLSAATDELADHTDHMEHLTSVFEHYQNLLSIIGKSKDYEAMGNFLQGQADTIKDRLSVAQSYYDVLLQQKDEIQAELETAIKSGDEAKIEMYQKEWDAIVDETDAAQEQVLSLTEEWAEAMKSVIQNNMEKIADTLEKTLAGGTAFDTLMDGFDKLNTRQEEYLTKTNQIYETNKLMRTASKALDETDNKVAKQKLKNFIDETKGLQETTQLSKYELEIQQAKYDLLLAQIALEEAQNAQSTVRLSRDSEGNFGYVYTADQNKIDDAQQAVDDADNKLYNLSLEGQQQYTEKYLQAEQAMYEELKQLQQDYLDGNIASEEEYELRKSQIQEHYLGPEGVLTTYSKLYNVAVQTDADATADYWGKDYGKMTQDTEAWKTAVNDYLLEIDDQINEWKNVQNQANKEVQGALTNSKKATKELTDESKNLRDTLNNKVIPVIRDEIDVVREQTDAYADQRAELLDLIATYEKYLATLDKQIASASNGNIDYSFEASKAFVAGDSEGVSSNLASRKDKAVVGVNTSVSGERLGNVFAAASGDSSYTKQQQEDAKNLINKVASKDKEYTDETLSAIGFSSGGYTGTWGPEGKLAVLHEKELILNQDDTQNILSTVSLIRELVNMIDAQAASASLFNLISTPSPNPNTNTLEQKVEITAEFPNVNDRYEIEEAFNNLVNRASQYANKAF